MRRTNHHRNQKSNHCGYDQGGKYKHNKHYGGGYGVDGRNAADSERRMQSKIDSRNGVNYYHEDIFNFKGDSLSDCYDYSDVSCTCCIPVGN